MIPMSARERSRLAQILAIQEAAVSLTLERGFQGFTMDDVASTTGLSRRTIFTRVGDKVSAVLGTDDSSWNEAVSVGLDASASPFDALAGAIREIAESFPIEDRVLQVNLGMREAIAREPRLAEEAEARSRRRAEALVSMIAEQRHWGEGDVRRALLAALAQTFVESAISRALAQYARSGAVSFTRELDDVAAAARQLIEVVS